MRTGPAHGGLCALRDLAGDAVEPDESIADAVKRVAPSLTGRLRRRGLRLALDWGLGLIAGLILGGGAERRTRQTRKHNG